MKFQASSCYTFRDIALTNLQCQIFKKKAVTPEKSYEIFKFSPDKLLIILYQLIKFQASIYYTF